MSGSNSQRVGEIFKTAGQAFNTLGQLTSQLESSGQNASKWTDQEIAMLSKAVSNFANDLQVISDAIKSRTVTQIKGTLQKKAFDEAGIVIQQQQVAPQPQLVVQNNSQVKQNADVTLNALNASESEVDVEAIGAAATDSSLDFDSAATDV